MRTIATIYGKRRLAALFVFLFVGTALAVQPNDPKQEMIDKIKFIKKDIDKTQKQIDDLKQDAIDGLGKDGKAEYDKDVADAKDLQDAHNEQFSKTQEAMNKARDNPKDADLEKESQKAQDKLSEIAQKKNKLDDKIRETMEKALEKLNKEKKKKLADLKQRLGELYNEGLYWMNEYQKYTGAPSPVKVAYTPPDAGPGDSIVALTSENEVTVAFCGTGETVGCVADLVIENLTDQPVTCVIPPVVLESTGGNQQNYGCPRTEKVALAAHQKYVVPLNGVCLARNKPPAGKGVRSDYAINDGHSGSDEHKTHIPPDKAHDLLQMIEAKYEAAEKLQRDHRLKDFPYQNKDEQENILVQWSTWADPRISETNGAPPATKEDLRKVVYKQIEQHGPVTPAKKKKIDQGIDTIFEKVELTTEKAKDLEKQAGQSST